MPRIPPDSNKKPTPQPSNRVGPQNFRPNAWVKSKDGAYGILASVKGDVAQVYWEGTMVNKTYPVTLSSYPLAYCDAPNRSCFYDPDNLPLISLHPAYLFDCDHCGQENFVRAVRPSIQPHSEEVVEPEESEEETDSGAVIGFDTDDDEYFKVPNVVECSRCGRVFCTVDDRDDYIPDENELNE